MGFYNINFEVLTHVSYKSSPFKFKRCTFLTIGTLRFFKSPLSGTGHFRLFIGIFPALFDFLHSFQAIYRDIPCSERLFVSWAQHLCVWLSAFLECWRLGLYWHMLKTLFPYIFWVLFKGPKGLTCFQGWYLTASDSFLRNRLKEGNIPRPDHTAEPSNYVLAFPVTAHSCVAER